jgi:hypothetical protein
VGLCFSGFFFFSTTIFSVGGLPTRSRANSLTAVTALNAFAFFFFATLRTPAADFNGDSSEPPENPAPQRSR